MVLAILILLVLLIAVIVFKDVHVNNVIINIKS